MREVTTVTKGFRVEDITFKNARRQSAINQEIEVKEVKEPEEVVPVSLTPEQVKAFYKSKIESCTNPKEKGLYVQTINWIDELLAIRKRLLLLESKEEVKNRVKEESIIEEGV